MSDPSPAHRRHHHRRAAQRAVPTAVITVSDTRTLEDDTGGALVVELLEGGGHPITSREIVPDDVDRIEAATSRAVEREDTRAVVLTGGTGVSPRDVTPDAVEPLLERELPGFGELFRWLSYEEIGSAALLSRALAGVSEGVLVFVVPGSRGGVRLALEKLILPELGHLAAEAVKGRDPSADG
ncbi:MAG: MogA/MoaB family molybdenum cofactor biosynthesis protein [Myxococcota bacterium]